LNGQVVNTFATGAELLASLETDGADCIISAAELPDMSGLALFAAVRASHPGVRFALMLSRNDHPAIAAARRHGVDAVFHKPLVHRRLKHFVTAV
jgi:DNA-binding NtrC family response regulator